jgi:hypothetical protein
MRNIFLLNHYRCVICTPATYTNYVQFSTFQDMPEMVFNDQRVRRCLVSPAFSFTTKSSDK